MPQVPPSLAQCLQYRQDLQAVQSSLPVQVPAKVVEEKRSDAAKRAIVGNFMGRKFLPIMGGLTENLNPRWKQSRAVNIGRSSPTGCRPTAGRLDGFRSKSATSKAGESMPIRTDRDITSRPMISMLPFSSLRRAFGVVRLNTRSDITGLLYCTWKVTLRVAVPFPPSGPLGVAMVL